MTDIFIHNNDVGTVFELTVVDVDADIVDISTAITKKIYLQKPDGTVLSKTAVFVTDGTDGKMKYTTIAGDINLVGNWIIQGYIETAVGKFYTEKTVIQVLESLSV